jgi:hypothetical protein
MLVPRQDSIREEVDGELQAENDSKDDKVGFPT